MLLLNKDGKTLHMLKFATTFGNVVKIDQLTTSNNVMLVTYNNAAKLATSL